VKLVLATANPGKAAEILEILGPSFELVPRPGEVPDVDEIEETLEGNARLKALALVEATGEPALADDTGLEVRALGGAPGVHTARYAGPAARHEDNVARIFAELEGAGDRSARFRTVALARFPDGTELVAEGVVDGAIATEPRGGNGFGYDPVFIPDEGDGRTFGEMTSAEKLSMSHRGRAFRALAHQLRTRV
jgi:XTP/dITP diphosphohydrolase